jgi:hypothetical protein
LRVEGVKAGPVRPARRRACGIAYLAAALALRGRLFFKIEIQDPAAAEELKIMLDRRTLARLLGGRINKWGAIEAPFPGTQSRWFEVRLDPDCPDGFKVLGVGSGGREEAHEHVRLQIGKFLDSRGL